MYDNAHFPRAKKFWYQGKFYDWTEPCVHVMSHALHYGTSVFEGIRAYSTAKGSAIFRLPEHVDRFLHSASVLGMKVPFSKEEICHAIQSTVLENQLESAYIRPLLFSSFGNLGLIPRHSPAELTIGAWEWGAYLGKKSRTGVKAYIVPWRRIHHSQFDMTAKLGGVYVQSAICGRLARSRGCDEAIFLNLEGNIAEGPGENILIVKDGILKTNDKSESILEGITRTTLLQLAEDRGIPTSIGPITKKELIQADEVFFSGTAVEIAPIVHVKDASDPDSPEKEYQIGSGQTGEVTQRIAQAYTDAVTGKTKDYEKWLTYINEEVRSKK